MELWGFFKSSLPKFLPQTQPWGLHGGQHRGILSRARGGFSPIISPPNLTKVPTVPYENMFRPCQVADSGHLLNGGLRGYCRGNLPRVPWAVGYGLRLLDTIGSLQWHTTGEPYTLY
jgi:hypothetical protein